MTILHRLREGNTLRPADPKEESVEFRPQVSSIPLFVEV